MHKAYKFRIYPTKEQATLMNKSIGCSRFVFNHFLAKWSETYQETGKGLTYHTCAKLLTALKKQFEWLKEVDAHALQSSLRNLDDAFKRFFKKQNDAPRFKSKRNKVQSYTTKIEKKNQLPEVSIQRNKVKLPKLGWVRFAKSREVEGRILSATIRRNPSGKYFISILCEMYSCPYVPVNQNKMMGVDLGLKEFAILSDGTK
ncbi:Helix-turn-helix domain-containing protein [Seinonella peptonophila]|uniref:Helix-turn-helix domain-containing protein n=1 Tax=Seinonella peptonophila TaxID=112248 RepID=A0A1M5BRS3_9BACL|nr:Helix-turn-helix domain-containing protein [Seinonella peptonophila]